MSIVDNTAELRDEVRRLRAEVERLKAYRALADEVVYTNMLLSDKAQADWLARYDALTKETTK